MSQQEEQEQEQEQPSPKMYLKEMSQEAEIWCTALLGSNETKYDVTIFSVQKILLTKIFC